jgi:hypothetical protein
MSSFYRLGSAAAHLHVVGGLVTGGAKGTIAASPPNSPMPVSFAGVVECRARPDVSVS